MIWECMEVFGRLLERNENLVLENYVPKDGDYYFVHMRDADWSVDEPISIFYDKKKDRLLGETHTSYEKACFLDYNSRLFDMNKPVDTKKIIHSNNYLSFFVKKESLFNGKLTQEIIDSYYEVLANPYLKYKTGKVKELYGEAEKICGDVNRELLEKIRQWVKEHIFQLLQETKEKNYLKLFFIFDDWEKTKDVFLQEGNRYLIPNIYNNNKYNERMEEEIYGLPNNNLQMNDKKPYLANHSRRKKVPFLLNRKEVLLQAKFYDYLEGFAAKGRYNIFFDTTEYKIFACQTGENPPSGFSGYYLRLKKGKEVEIQSADTVVYYNENMRPEFYYEEYMEAGEESQYGVITKMPELEGKIDEIFFSKMLVSNYFTKPEDIKINDRVLAQQLISMRERIFSWFHKDTGQNIMGAFNQCAWRLIINSVLNGYMKKAKDQINLLWSLEAYYNGEEGEGKAMQEAEKKLWDHIDSDDWDFDSEEEFYFAVGQAANYFINKSKAAKKNLSLANPFLTAKSAALIQQRLTVLFQRYNYDISISDRRAKNLISHIMGYKTNGKVNREMIVSGLTAKNVIYRSKDKEE